VLNVDMNRAFRKGNCVGDADIILKRNERLDDFKTLTDCYFLRMGRRDVIRMIEEYPEIGEEMKEWVRTKELIRTNKDLFKQIEVPDHLRDQIEAIYDGILKEKKIREEAAVDLAQQTYIGPERKPIAKFSVTPFTFKINLSKQ